MSRKKGILSEPKQTPAAVPRNSTSDDVRPRRPARERLTSSVLEELWSIWRADSRVPSIRSRREWAISRNANPRLVGSWFLRRRTCAKKAGKPVSDGSYDLPLGPPIAPKRERSATPVDPELEAVPDLPSDDTLAYPPDSDDLNNMEASSDTVFDEDTLVESKRIETAAYKEVQPRSSRHRHFQQKQSIADLYTEDRCDEDTPSFENTSLPVCNQGRGNWSDFMCVLCASKSIQGDSTSISPAEPMYMHHSDARAPSDEDLLDSGAMSDLNSKWNVTVPCPRLDFSPDTLSELSAIPFLFRTPHTVSADSIVSHPSADNWTIVEDELGRLVNDGKLDFSFLDVPHIASMELHA